MLLPLYGEIRFSLVVQL